MTPDHTQGPQSSSTGKQQPGRARVITFSSGKGGVGKTNTTINLGLALAKKGSRVCILDADIGLANLGILLGVTPTHTLEQFLAGQCTLQQLLFRCRGGIDLIAGAAGISPLTILNNSQRKRLINALETLEHSYDYILIDTAAGMSPEVMNFIRIADYAVIVVTTEPTSLTDAFALLRALKGRRHQKPIHVLVNMALNYGQSIEVYGRLAAAVSKYLDTRIHYLGYIADDQNLKAAVSKQSPVLLQFPDSYASRCFATLADVVSDKRLKPTTTGLSQYWLARSDADKGLPRPDQQIHDREQGRRLARRLAELISSQSLSQHDSHELIGILVNSYRQLHDADAFGVKAATASPAMVVETAQAAPPAALLHQTIAPQLQRLEAIIQRIEGQDRRFENSLELLLRIIDDITGENQDTAQPTSREMASAKPR